MIDFLDVSFSDEDGHSVFYGLNISIGRGERVILAGPVSSGRAEFISLIGGFDRADTGVVSVFGANVARLDEDGLCALRRKVGFILKENILVSNLKIIENVALPLMYHGNIAYDECMNKAVSRLTEAGFKGDIWAQPAALDAAEKKFVLCARAVVAEPDLVICSNLFDDIMPSDAERIAEFLGSYQASRKDCSVIYAVDSQDDLPFVNPTRVLKMEGNRIIGVR